MRRQPNLVNGRKENTSRYPIAYQHIHSVSKHMYFQEEYENKFNYTVWTVFVTKATDADVTRNILLSRDDLPWRLQLAAIPEAPGDKFSKYRLAGVDC